MYVSRCTWYVLCDPINKSVSNDFMKFFFARKRFGLCFNARAFVLVDLF